MTHSGIYMASYVLLRSQVWHIEKTAEEEGNREEDFEEHHSCRREEAVNQSSSSKSGDVRRRTGQ